MPRIYFNYGKSSKWIGFRWVPWFSSGKLKCLTITLLRRELATWFDYRDGSIETALGLPPERR